MSESSLVKDFLCHCASGDGAHAAAHAMGTGRRLGLLVGEEELTISTTLENIEIVNGVESADVVVALDSSSFGALRREELSVFGLLYSGKLRIVAGEFEHFAAWEPALQALLFQRPIFDMSSDIGSQRNRFSTSWTLESDTREMSKALTEFGFVHIRSVFSHSEIEEMSSEVNRLREVSEPGDRQSWWASMEDGSEVCCRITYMAQRSEIFARLADDERLNKLAALSGNSLKVAHDRLDGISVVIKNPGATAGLSDLPWHRDCGLGGHNLLCPGLNLGINLDHANAESGQLWFLPGSHLHGGPIGDPVASGYSVLPIETNPGDVTIHFGHLLHAAPPPTGTGAGRRAVYVSFVGPAVFDSIGVGQAYNDVIYSSDDGSVRNVAEASA